MSGYLLDTNCISELVRDKPQPSVMAWIETADETLLYLSLWERFERAWLAWPKVGGAHVWRLGWKSNEPVSLIEC